MIATLTMCSLDFDEDYIPHFLTYYNQQGVDRHLLILHSKKIVDEEALRDKYCNENIDIFFAYGEWNCIFLEGIKHNILKKIGVGQNDWIINTDIDEQVGVQNKTIKEKIFELEINQQNVCRGLIVDRIALNGELPEIQPEIPLSEQFPLYVNITRRLLKGDIRKFPITRGDLNVKGGSHRLTAESFDHANIHDEILTINHYKWTSNVIDKLQERIATHKSFAHWRESDRFLRYWKRHKNLLLDQNMCKLDQNMCKN